jgi:GTP-binding protein Era
LPIVGSVARFRAVMNESEYPEPPNREPDTCESSPSGGSDPTAAPFRAGFVAILGLANVGKSTLLNALVGERLSIVTPKAQTTRRRLLGIYTDSSHQALFLDTPGWLEPRYALQEAMQAEASGALAGADVTVAVLDAAYPPSLEWTREFRERIQRREHANILCINKIDLITEADLEAMVEEFGGAPWAAIVPTAAERGFGIDELRRGILARLPESPPFYPEDELSDVPVREFAAELVRETCFEQLGQEVPYAIAVQVEEFKDRGPDLPLYIETVLYVEKESQKGIVIGSGGKMIRRIGSASRRKIEEFLDRGVYLDLRVKVLPNWRKQYKHLRVLGFRVPGEEN